jgi:hypothetical protein
MGIRDTLDFQILEQRQKNEHCLFCQSDVKLTYCKNCDEITAKECPSCDCYSQDPYIHHCEVNFSRFNKGD